MKSIRSLQVLILVFTTLVSCTKNNDILKENSIIGTWQLVEVYNNSGAGSGNWSAVENGYKYIFSSDNKFTTTRFSAECSSGIYTLQSDELILDFGCDGFTTGIETPEGTFVEKMTFEQGYLILQPTYLYCIEGCGWKFKKIN